jgi:hypothetical protein
MTATVTGATDVPPLAREHTPVVSRTSEQGDVFFFYRPRVGVDEVDELTDVQQFFVVLAPDGRDLYRRLLVGRKRLPDPHAHERGWAFVAEVAHSPEDLRAELRAAPTARAAGEGRYAVVAHDGERPSDHHTHLAYVLELPHEPGPAQEAFRIRPEASYVVAVRNPRADAPSGTGLRADQRAKYPPDLQERFGDRRFVALDDPRFLDFENAEVVLIGAAEDVESELGTSLDREHERVETAAIVTRLRVRPDDLPLDPLEHGDLR